MDKEKRIKQRKWRRKQRVRGKVFGTQDRLRLSVYRSNKHIYAQVVDDVNGHTLVQASTLEKNLQDRLKDKTLKEKSWEVGMEIAKKCLGSGVKKVVFDKNRFAYHGCVKRLAEGAREGGLQF